MKPFSYVLAALTVLAVAPPAIAEVKPMMNNEGMKTHHTMRHHHSMMRHKSHKMHGDKMMMKKDTM
jgi:hypothetical protein